MWRGRGRGGWRRGRARTPRSGGGDDARKADADAEVIRPFEMRARGECVGKVWSGNGETGGEGEVETPEETPEVRIAARARDARSPTPPTPTPRTTARMDAGAARNRRETCIRVNTRAVVRMRRTPKTARAPSVATHLARVRGKGRDERRDVERRKTTTSCALRGPLAVSRRHTIPSEREHHRARRHQTQRERVATSP